MDVILVTGIGGFIGRHIAAELLRAGFSVRGTLRDAGRIGDIEASIRADAGPSSGTITFATADLLAEGGWAEAMQGIAAVVHSASPFPAQVPENDSDLVRPAREGTLRVLSAARQAGVERVVLTSSIAAVCYGSGRSPFTEADWTDPDGPLTTPYYRSKTLAERAAWDYAKAEGLALSVINPGLVLGPLIGRDYGTSVGIVAKAMRGVYPAVPKLALPVVDVRDVARAHVLALQTPAAIGERFIAATETLTFLEIMQILRLHFPSHARKLPRFTVPNALARIVERFDRSLTPIVRELGRDTRVSNEKARRVLGWAPRTSEEAVVATGRSLIAAGLV
ncbi:dihydroflavonol-4-reductase [Rhizobium sp. RU20A]|uniref:SDR family oxidoreductase n=1 Tax=Rhizobium sp. RU20A TaxID=1907412 RepID=UPI00095523D4|nr:aldehyde reductase [Rhizobium sp. RU20A]SIQ11345.1 dihydroflavonol-4-reductase [Rhizobium sp. RU20A]